MECSRLSSGTYYQGELEEGQSKEVVASGRLIGIGAEGEGQPTPPSFIHDHQPPKVSYDLIMKEPKGSCCHLLTAWFLNILTILPPFLPFCLADRSLPPQALIGPYSSSFSCPVTSLALCLISSLGHNNKDNNSFNHDLVSRKDSGVLLLDT